MMNHRWLEGQATLFAVLSLLAVLAGTVLEVVPVFTKAGGPAAMDGITPYTALEVKGRDIYVREGCYVCHSQMVRPFRSETLRYGPWSRGGEYAYDRPFQLGSRRIGPDLHRVGGKYPDAWHYEHMRDPRATSTGSVMPPYPWLVEWTYTKDDVQKSMRALKMAGTPYTDADIDGAPAAIDAQASAIVKNLADAGITTTPDKEIVALISYLQRLGADGRKVLAEAK